MSNRDINANSPFIFTKKPGDNKWKKQKKSVKSVFFTLFLYRMLADSKISRNFASCFSWY